jgi:streptomycin 6-kinase
VDAFEGRGVVRVYEYVEGALLLERLTPGRSLASMSLSGADDDAAEVLAQTIGSMSPRTPGAMIPTTEDWEMDFDRYLGSGDQQVPRSLVMAAQQLFSELSGSQTQIRLLHGDLHHYNVLFDDVRGWLAVDPKGVVGELEYEVGAALRNPYERPELFAEPSIVRKRVERFASILNLDATRVVSWAFAQAVLAAIWAVEDGLPVEPDNRLIALANVMRPMLGHSVRG